jgi:uncharacterized protein GlcG (DUF336 family)
MQLFTKKSITALLANQMIEAATKKAQEIGFSIAITIVDESGNLKAFSRMDNAPLISIDASRKKAITAVGFGFPTGDAWYNFIKDDPILNGGAHNLKDFILLGGGSPITIDATIVGAIGISGGHYKQDEQCMNAALSILA